MSNFALNRISSEIESLKSDMQSMKSDMRILISEIQSLKSELAKNKPKEHENQKQIERIVARNKRAKEIFDYIIERYGDYAKNLSVHGQEIIRDTDKSILISVREDLTIIVKPGTQFKKNFYPAHLEAVQYAFRFISYDGD